MSNLDSLNHEPLTFGVFDESGNFRMKNYQLTVLCLVTAISGCGGGGTVSPLSPPTTVTSPPQPTNTAGAPTQQVPSFQRSFAASQTARQGDVGTTTSVRQVVRKATVVIDANAPNGYRVTGTQAQGSTQKRATATVTSSANLGEDGEIRMDIRNVATDIRLTRDPDPNSLDYSTRDVNDPSQGFVLYNIDGSPNTVRVVIEAGDRADPADFGQEGYTSFVVWQTGEYSGSTGELQAITSASGISGLETPLANLPAGGQVLFTGHVDYFVSARNAGTEDYFANMPASLTLDFSNGTATGTFDVFDYSGTLADGELSGTMRVGATNPDNLNANASGPVNGAVYGPNSEEAAGTFQIVGNNSNIQGVFITEQ